MARTKERLGSQLPKWSVIERWTEGDPEPCITHMAHLKYRAEESARIYNKTMDGTLEYVVMLTADAVAEIAASERQRS